MANKSTAGSDFGSYKSGAMGLYGLNNIGLLGKVFGRVVGGGADYFMINDGSGPIRVYTSGALNPLSSPPPASYAAVTGLIGITEETPGGNLIRALRPRWNSDIWYAFP